MMLGKYTRKEFIIVKSVAMIIEEYPQCRAFSRAVNYEKLLSPPFPVGRGAVVIND